MATLFNFNVPRATWPTLFPRDSPRFSDGTYAFTPGYSTGKHVSSSWFLGGVNVARGNFRTYYTSSCFFSSGGIPDTSWAGSPKGSCCRVIHRGAKRAHVIRRGGASQVQAGRSSSFDLDAGEDAPSVSRPDNLFFSKFRAEQEIIRRRSECFHLGPFPMRTPSSTNVHS